MTKCCVVLTTTKSEKNAQLIAQTLVDKKLSACVQIDKVTSFFEYNGACKQVGEFRLMIKSASENYKRIEQLIKINHEYQLPQIIKLDITDGLLEYIEWILSKS